MPLLILAVLIAVPLAEIAVFIEVGGAIGLWPTLAVIVATALAGIALLRHQGLQTVARARASLDRQRFPVREVFHGLCLVIAGVLLLIPGFLTDALGFVLFVPAVREWLARRVLRRLAASGRVQVWPDEEGAPMIEGEFHEIEPRRPDRDDEPPGRGR